MEERDPKSSAHTGPEQRILILDSDPQDLDRAQAMLSGSFPSMSVDTARSLDECAQKVEEAAFGVIVLEYEFAHEGMLELIRSLRSLENEPSLLLVSRTADPKALAAAYDSGCHKCLVKGEDWLAELPPAVRQLFRFRRLEEQNVRLLSRLTEANILLEEKNRRLDEFTSTLAHDIRGPLGGVAMKMDYILEGYREQLPPRVVQLLERSEQALMRLTNIVQTMYEYARMGKEAAKMGEVDLEGLVRGVVNDLSFDQKLDIQIGIDHLPRVWGNQELLSRVFINLITNAVKYNDKSSIVVNVGFNRIYEKSVGNFCELFVEDNGPGISEDEQQEIFEMFSRGVSGAAHSDGMGIGLSVVQRIVELHHGKVHIESTPGKGTRFIISLPAEPIEFAG